MYKREMVREGEVNERKKAGLFLAQACSFLLHPFLMPLYGVLMLLYGPTYLAILPGKLKIYLVSLFILTTLLFPAFSIALLKNLKILPNLSLSSQKERIVPLLIVTIGYVSCLYLTANYIVLGIIPQLLGGALAVVIVCFAINFFWKISLHMAAMGGSIAILLFLTMSGYGMMEEILLISILLAGLLATARLYLGKHNIWQVLAGFGVGFTVMGTGLLLF